MTDHRTPTDDDLSLALDGEADADLLARIEADPDARARLEQLRAAASLASTPVTPLGGDAVDELIATAVDAPVAPVVSARARRGQRRAAPWLVAASVILLMAVGLTLVWAGRSSDDDQASATLASAADKSSESAESSNGGAAADTNFSGSGSTATDQAAPAGGHGSPTTIAPSTSSASLPLLYLGSYESGDALREATAGSFADAWKASGSKVAYQGGDTAADEVGRSTTSGGTPPTAEAVDRCGDQLQVTLSTKAGPVQTGYATVDGEEVLVYEFAAASARDGRETTLVAAVGTDACDEVVIFER